MKQLIGLALLLMFMGGVFLFAPVGDTRASNLTMPQNSNSDDTMRGMHMQNRRHHRRHHRWENRRHRRHHRHSMANANR